MVKEECMEEKYFLQKKINNKGLQTDKRVYEFGSKKQGKKSDLAQNTEKFAVLIVLSADNCRGQF
jgi:hypothetical protein